MFTFDYKIYKIGKNNTRVLNNAFKNYNNINK